MTALQAVQTASALTIASDFDDAVRIILKALAPSSRRVYLHTYNAWLDFAANHGFDGMALTLANIDAFVNQADVARSTRQNRLSHMRRLQELFAIDGGEAAKHYAAVKRFCKVQAQDADDARKPNSKRALSQAELAHFLDVWSKDKTAVGIRNNALIRLGVYTGLRRSELVALRWSDVNLESKIITVREGKGGKSRAVKIADITEGTARAMKALREAQGQKYEFVFPRMTRGKGARFGDDKPANPQTVMTVVLRTHRLADIGHLSPHDLRRTNITQSLAHKAPLADVQAQAGHSRAETTLRYAQANQAQARLVGF